ncbi:MAG: hypothetical protein JWM36_2622 [Hyphomicrobiales bacterium]|nr:hypothetical protein [Hyphomicrobiales bacterium]
MHASIASFRSDEDLIREAIRQYAIGLTSCLETYYRDLYVALLETDAQFLQRLFSGDKWGARLVRIRATEPGDISDAELAGELIKFQNLFGIDQALSEILQPKGYIEALSSSEFMCMIPSKRSDIASIKLWPDWQIQFSSIFDHRHEFVHDANKVCGVTPAQMAGIEATALLVPQLTTFLVAQELGARGALLAMNGALPTVLIVEDLISNDWEIVREST